jgi:hypothetical protein
MQFRVSQIHLDSPGACDMVVARPIRPTAQRRSRSASVTGMGKPGFIDHESHQGALDVDFTALVLGFHIVCKPAITVARLLSESVTLLVPCALRTPVTVLTSGQRKQSFAEFFADRRIGVRGLL